MRPARPRASIRCRSTSSPHPACAWTFLDQRRLHKTLAALRPRLLVLDPFVRLHRIDENSAAEVSAVLAFLREVQRARHRCPRRPPRSQERLRLRRPGAARLRRLPRLDRLRPLRPPAPRRPRRHRRASRRCRPGPLRRRVGLRRRRIGGCASRRPG
ncbi:MAG: AAA family ATPase [Myxococcales bacterium]|nr:AAA family ATPase [Myxococcales bacterium]